MVWRGRGEVGGRDDARRELPPPTLPAEPRIAEPARSRESSFLLLLLF